MLKKYQEYVKSCLLRFESKTFFLKGRKHPFLFLRTKIKNGNSFRNKKLIFNIIYMRRTSKTYFVKILSMYLVMIFFFILT
jgi:hypothetical protein